MRSPFAVEPRRVDKPWGHELIWAETGIYVGKLISVAAGHALSLQYHEQKDECWYVQQGRGTVELGELGGTTETIEIAAGDSFHFPPFTLHRLTALEDIVILEVSTAELDDVVRIEDRYGRTGR